MKMGTKGKRLKAKQKTGQFGKVHMRHLLCVQLMETTKRLNACVFWFCSRNRISEMDRQIDREECEQVQIEIKLVANVGNVHGTGEMVYRKKTYTKFTIDRPRTIQILSAHTFGWFRPLLSLSPSEFYALENKHKKSAT